MASTPSHTGPLARRTGPELAARLLAQLTLAPGAHAHIGARAPWTGDVLTHVPAGQPADAEAAVSLARAAQPAWAARPWRERAAIFLRFHDLLLDRQDEILDLIQHETGKARRHAFEEVLDTAVVCRYYALRTGRLLGPRRRRGALPLLTATWELRSPVGVVAFVVPWNYPLNLAITDAAPALLAGNTAVLKPDRQTTLTALWAVDLLREAGLPAGVFPVVSGEGAVLGPALGELADYVMFTGSTRTGRSVARQAAGRLIGCSLELGGKNPMLVLAGADMEAAAEGAVRGCFAGAGQVCVSIERIYVHESLFERFTARFVERTRGLALGAALDYTMEIGSLTTARQLEAIAAHVEDARAKGATVLAGGRARPDLGPLFYEPTILTGVREGMALFAEETFGPVVSVYPFTSEDEAVALANATPYGLNASVWTRDRRAGLRVARQIRAGSVNVNEGYAAAWGSVDAPVGGMKQSGIGRRHGSEGMLKFTEVQNVAVRRGIPIAPCLGLGTARWARWMTRLLRVVRRTRIAG